MTTVSLCMIVKNEAKWLPRSLAAAQPFFDEMIVVDTGSTDNTPEIGTNLGAKVHFFPWQDDFAVAKNQALDLATGDWAFILDADEILHCPNSDLLRKLAATGHALGLQAYIVSVLDHYSGYDTPPENMLQILRFFRRSSSIRYQGRIHEDLYLPPEAVGLAPPELQIHHYGYVPAEMERKAKNQRNLRLLNEVLQEEHDPRSRRFHLFSLARINQRIGRPQVALEQATAALGESLGGLTDSLDPMLLHLRLRCLIDLDLLAEALAEAKLILQRFPDYTEVACLQAEALLGLHKFAEAEAALLAALKIPVSRPWLVNADLRVHSACWYYLGCIYALQHKTSLAATCLAKATLAAAPVAEALPKLQEVLTTLPHTEGQRWLPSFWRTYPSLREHLEPLLTLE